MTLINVSSNIHFKLASQSVKMYLLDTEDEIFFAFFIVEV